MAAPIRQLPLFEGRTVRALVFDVDGTLYRQRPLRLQMAWRLALAHVGSPRLGLATARMLSAYRKAQEALRETDTSEPLEAAQLRVAAETSGLDLQRIEACVRRWMVVEPLPLLAGCRREGLLELLEWARASGIRVGVVSDYPALEKLQALGIAHQVEVVVTAQDAEVQRFKPDPRGLVAALHRLGVEPSQALYLGDRPEIDGVTADRAGVGCLLVGGSPTTAHPWTMVRDFHEARRLLG